MAKRKRNPLQKLLYSFVRVPLPTGKSIKIERYAFLFPVFIFGTIGIAYLLLLLFARLYVNGTVDFFTAFNLFENTKFLTVLVMIGFSTHYFVHYGRQLKKSTTR